MVVKRQRRNRSGEPTPSTDSRRGRRRDDTDHPVDDRRPEPWPAESPTSGPGSSRQRGAARPGPARGHGSRGHAGRSHGTRSRTGRPRPGGSTSRSGRTKGEKTRRAILDAAIARFGRDGFRATSVADIARSAGVGGTVAYAYFPSKEALFLAALDEDAAAVIDEGLAYVFAEVPVVDWREGLLLVLVEAVERHPLARRVLAGLEPDVTDRVADIPALTELRKLCGQRLRAEQQAGTVRGDIDPELVGSGLVTIVLSLLMSVVQLGTETVAHFADEVVSVLEAAIAPPSSTPASTSGGAVLAAVVAPPAQRRATGATLPTSTANPPQGAPSTHQDPAEDGHLDEAPRSAPGGAA